MKAKEFDELVKQKFDQNDFEYKPQNWARLVDKMDEKPGKKRTLLWIPLAILASVSSVAACIAMIIVMPSFLQHKNNTPIAHVVDNASIQINTIDDAQQLRAHTETIHASIVHIQKKTAELNKPANIQNINFDTKTNNLPALRLPDPQLTVLHKKADPVLVFNTFNSSVSNQKSQVSNFFGRYSTRRPANFDFDDHDLARKTMVGISSGVNYGASVSGYSIGATGRRMLGNKFYLEGDVAFMSNTATEKSSYTQTFSSVSGMGNARRAMSARNTGDGASITEVNYAYTYVSSEMKENNYNLYYAQFTPSVGYKIHKQFSIGVGGDMQHLLLGSNTPTVTDNTGAMKEIPSFDLGVVGNAECNLNKKIKAGMCYRQGINNVLNGGNRYLDRNYMQVQIKYMIFNK